MALTVIDHTYHGWRERRRQTNGAETYSLDLIAHQLDGWRKVLGENDVISTCPKLSDVRLRGCFRYAIQYLHTFPFIQPVEHAREITRRTPAKRVVFVVAYKRYAELLREAGFAAIYAPMTIDALAVAEHKADPIVSFDRILWFGNVYKTKIRTFAAIKAACEKAGMALDTISRDRYNGKPVTQRDALGILSRYRYAVAVGRCALEAYTLGLRVLIAGNGCGGIVTNDVDLELQRSTNFNARYSTYSNDPDECLKALPLSMTGFSFDIRHTNHAEQFENFR